MKTIKYYIKTSSIILILLTLCQSCVVYHKNPVTMKQAAQEETKTKILLKDGRIEKFKYVTYKDDQYFGSRMTGDGLVNIPIDENSVNEVQIKNKTASILVTVIPLAAITALVIAGSNMSFGSIY